MVWHPLQESLTTSPLYTFNNYLLNKELPSIPLCYTASHRVQPQINRIWQSPTYNCHVEKEQREGRDTVLYIQSLLECVCVQPPLILGSLWLFSKLLPTFCPLLPPIQYKFPKSQSPGLFPSLMQLLPSVPLPSTQCLLLVFSLSLQFKYLLFIFTYSFAEQVCDIFK